MILISIARRAALIGAVCWSSLVVGAPAPADTHTPLNISGTYPHLAVFSDAGEIGIGAVADWAGRLWFVTYSPHAPNGSADQLWTVDTNLALTAWPGSVGGTPANRMIHRESQQLNLGPYFIDATGSVRVVSPKVLPGRLTGTARHLSDPANKVLIATMEEGIYAVDVHTLAVRTLRPDLQPLGGREIPGTHGKGFYSGQGRLVYANNGESGWTVAKEPGWRGPAGVLTENVSAADFTNGWRTLARTPFTEVTGPGGIYGNANAGDPIWALGWDRRSVLLKLLDRGVWFSYRLPKGSYTHDSFQGWFTEWPRIREVQHGTLLMHMHGLFYYFPKTFTAASSGGLRPICTYLKMPVDYCWWNGQLVIGRDDASTTGGNRWAGQSHSAPWFGQLQDLERWGTPAGAGGPWLDDAVTNGVASDPFLVAGFRGRVLHLKHTSSAPVQFEVQYDRAGEGTWVTLTNLAVPAWGYAWHVLPPDLDATWVRLVPAADATGVTTYFHLRNANQAPQPALFAGLADIGEAQGLSDGIVRPRSGDARALEFAANRYEASGALVERAYYEIGGTFVLERATNGAAEQALRKNFGLAKADFAVDAASVVVTEGTNRFRLPKTSAAYDFALGSGWPRGVREVVTERHLFNAHGTFYEVPLGGSGGMRRLRPVATHLKRISDFASWRGLLVLAGTAASTTNDGHVFRSSDGLAGLWFGDVDDLWRLGAPRGQGGPWKDSQVRANEPSDPYLMFGYRRKTLELSHPQPGPIRITVEVDIAADNTWCTYGQFTVPAGETLRHTFADDYSAHWVRLRADTDGRVTSVFTYSD